MSWALQALVSSRRTGSPTRRLVLISMASRANDDGSGVYASLPTIAAWCELDARSVRRIVRELEAEGLIRVAGQRRIRNGFVNDWAMNVEAIRALPSIQDELELRRMTPDTVSGVVVSDPDSATKSSGHTGHSVRPDIVSARTECPVSGDPHRTQCPPSVASPRTECPVTPDTVSAKPIHEPNIPLSSEATPPQTSPAKRGTAVRGSRISEDWRPSEHARAQCRGYGLEDWQVTSIAEEFLNFWLAQAGSFARKQSWDRTFMGRCRTIAGDPKLRSKILRPTVAAVDVPPEVWAKREAAWRFDGGWNDAWGPEPNKPGYRGPKPDLFQAGGAR